MVTIAGSLLGEMAPAPAPPDFQTPLEQVEEGLRQDEIEAALENLKGNVAAINNAIAAVEKNAPFARQEAQIRGLPGKFSQPEMMVEALLDRREQIGALVDQLKGERSVPGARAGLNRYNANIGTLVSPPQEFRYNPPQQYQNISFQSPQTQAQQEAIQQSFNVMDEAIRSAETQAQQEAAQQSFNVMDEAIRSAPTPMTMEEQVTAMMDVEAAIAREEAQVASSNLAAMSTVANQAAAEAFSNAIAKGETVAAATAAAEQAAQTAAQQAATQVGINPNSPTVTEVAMNAVNTQAVGIGSLASMTPGAVAAAAQQAVTLGQQGKIGKNTLNELGLLGPLGLAITAQEVEARRAREAQAIMERAMLNPAPVSPPTPERNVPTPTRNPSPAFQVPAQNRAMTTSLFGPPESNVLNFPAPPPLEPDLLNPNYNPIDRLTSFSPPGLRGLTSTPGLTLGTMPAGVPGFTSPSPVTSMPSTLTGFTAPDPPQISSVTPVSPAASFFSEPEPVAPDATPPAGSGVTVSGVQSDVPGISVAPTGMTGVSGLSPAQSAQVARGETLSSLSVPSRSQNAITSMMDLEQQLDQQQAQQTKDAINAMMGVEATLAQQQANQQAKSQRAEMLGNISLPAPAPAPTTSRSSSSRGRSGGQSSRGRSGGRSSSGRSSTSTSQSQTTRSVPSWSPENQISFTEEQTSDTGSNNKSIVCSAMNRTYGFGSFRNKLWIEQSKNLDPAYERGYHAIALPLIAFAYAGESFPRRAVKTFLEHAARRRTADIWKQKRGRRDWIGAVERAIIEPICYLVGKMLGPKRGE